MSQLHIVMSLYGCLYKRDIVFLMELNTLIGQLHYLRGLGAEERTIWYL